jgi:tetratricopeptide (TPR) repeat protein
MASYVDDNSLSCLYDIGRRDIVLALRRANSRAFYGQQIEVNGVFQSPEYIQDSGTVSVSEVSSLQPSSTSPELPSFGESTCYFVGVGNTVFADKRIPPLKYTASDVSSLAYTLGQRLRKTNTEFLPMVMVDTPNARQSLGTTLFDVQRNATPKDTVVIALSSHGVRLNRGLYVVTPETDLNSPQATAIGWPEFVESIAQIKAKRIYVFLDVCHAGSFSEANIEILESAKKRLAEIPGLVVIASSKPGEASLELHSVKHGAFTQALLECISERPLFETAPDDLISQLVKRTHTLTNGYQTPVLVVNNAIEKVVYPATPMPESAPGIPQSSEPNTRAIPSNEDALTLLLGERGDGYDAFLSLKARTPENLTPEQLLAFTILQLSFGDEASTKLLEPYFAAADSVDGLCERAVLYFKTGEKVRAISTAKRARELADSKITWHLLDLLFSFGEGSTNDDYLQFAAAYKERFPDFDYAHASYGNAMKADSHTDAIAFLRPACERFPMSTRLLNCLGHSQYSTGQYADARETYDRAIELAPQYGNLYSMRGIVAYREGDAARFEDDWLMSAQLSPNEIHLANRIEIYLRRGMNDMAFDEAELLFQQYQTDQSAVLLVYAAFRLGKKSRAQEVYRAITDAKLKLQAENLIRAIRAETNQDRTDRYLKELNQGSLFVVAAKELETCAAGMSVGVTTEDVAIKSVKSELGRTGIGAAFRIKEENGNWLLGDFWVNDETVTGWVPSNLVKRIEFGREQ